MSGPVPTCAECRFWTGDDDALSGECHFRAPFGSPRGGVWPETASDEFCGEGEYA